MRFKISVIPLISSQTTGAPRRRFSRNYVFCHGVAEISNTEQNLLEVPYRFLQNCLMLITDTIAHPPVLLSVRNKGLTRTFRCIMLLYICCFWYAVKLCFAKVLNLKTLKRC